MVEIFVPVAAGVTVLGTVLCATLMCCGRCLVPSLFQPPVLDHLRYANVEGEGLADLVTCNDISHCCKHCREQREQEALVSSCSKVRYSKRANSCPNETCAICLDDFREREYVTVCPCGHGYHRDCLIGWLQTTPSCPVCKSSVTTQNANTERTPLLP